MTPRAKLTVYSALACALATFCLLPLVTSSGWYLHACLLIALVAGAGAGLRRLPLPRWLVPAGQLLVLVYALMLGFTGSALTGGVLPGPQAIDAVGTLLDRGFQDIQEYAIPAPASPGLRLILVGSVALVAVVVDTVAVTFRRAALAGLPLLALYSVGTGLADEDGRAWLWFLCAAFGYLLLLLAEGQDRLSRWGRVFHGGARGTDRGGRLSHNGHPIGVLALATALVLPMFIGHWDSPFGHGTGNGLGSGGNGTGVTTLDPLVTLAAKVSRPSGEEMLTYTMSGDNAGSTYLRTGALDEFNGTEWKLSPKDVTANPRTMPTPEGLAPSVSADPVATAFTVTDRMDSAWLPMPYPVTEAAPPGNWRYEGSTRTLIGDGKQTTRGLKYEVTSLDVRPTAAQLRTAGPVPEAIAKRYLTLPGDFPQAVATIATDVTRGKGTGYDKAVALQTWFTRTGGFQYSTDVAGGTGNDAIITFLENKKGFCVHYASTMAAMARALGIPARVALGFTPGQGLGGKSFKVTDREYHAWPELYFQGTGWLRFEPTPTRGSTPDYTDPVAVPTAAPTQQPTTAAPSAGALPSASASTACDGKQKQLGDCADQDKAAAKAAAERSWWMSWQVLAGIAGGIALVGLLAAPMLWRSRLRRRRLGLSGRRRPGSDARTDLSDQQVLAAWEELVDSAWDLGIPPDDARTPRSAARRIAEAGELDESATAAAGRIALATERVLYARPGVPAAPLAPDVRAARAGLRASAKRAGRARALLLPPSSARLWWRATDRVDDVRDAVRDRGSRATAAITGPWRRALARLRPGRSGHTGQGDPQGPPE
ncbi:transglutaminaseTgpA domain-containing protein [Kitasatospora sp. NPDC057015]|uniref:transglutaminaseTgpA domain-containing protein n=1 Tax=Kitasatospora sp. NPDC057015 TaxID=3346001 RepID=UPI003628F922